MVRYRISVFLAIAVLLSGTVTAEAGNGRGTVSPCDDAGLIGAAYAACHVYCETLDCDSESPSGSERSCRNALVRFEDLTGGSTPPCEVPEGLTCPCSEAWHGVGFFPEYPDPATSFCTVITGSEEMGWTVLSIIDEYGGSSALATVSFNRISDPAFPWELVSCSSTREPVEPGAPDTGTFDMGNTYSAEAAGVHQLQQAIIDACQADLMALVDQFGETIGLECEIVDMSGE